MPANTIIIGVDLAPIKPIPKIITFQSDITTDKCRVTLRQHLKSWKVDTVLHDGAPNVGIAWVQDAFSQAELALQAMKLATEFLVEGGTFITKVFRSKDYNALLWVFNQLFNKVEATKPPASRNVSAEIFVVCRGFKAAKHIDPKFLDPRSVFAELANPTPNHEVKVFNPEKKKRKRDGYDEGDYVQFKEAPASEFIQASDPIAMLGSLNRLKFGQDANEDIALAALDQIGETTPEIRQCCADLKVLGRKEFRMLLRWRLKARERFGLGIKSKKEKEEEYQEIALVTPMDEELRIQEELHHLNEYEMSRKRRDKRRENERKQKGIVRMQMHMIAPTDIGLEQSGPKGEDSMFTLNKADRAGAVEKVSRGHMDADLSLKDQESESSAYSEDDSDREEDQLERDLDTLYLRYRERKTQQDAKTHVKRLQREHNRDDWEGFSGDERGVLENFERKADYASEDDEDGRSSPISLTHPPYQSTTESKSLTRRASLFFDQDIFQGIESTEPEDADDSAIDMNEDDSSSGSIRDLSTQHYKEIMVGKDSAVSTTQAGFSKHPKDTNQLGQPDERQDCFSDHDRHTNFEVVKDQVGSGRGRQTEIREDGRLSKAFDKRICCKVLG